MRICISFLLAGFLALSTVSAEELTVQQWQQLHEEATFYFSNNFADQVANGEAAPIKCGTPLIQAITAVAADKSAAGLFDRHDSLSFKYGTLHFLLHYTNQGADSIYQYTKQDSLPGVPNYIYEAGQAFEHAYRHIVDTLGFRAPLSDGYYNNGAGGGGDGRIDVYFINLGYYGATVPESTQATLPLTATSFLLLENDYYGFPGYANDRIKALQVSAAHEFFHTIEFSLDVTEAEGSGASQSTAWAEMSATFMEEENYNDVNDYYGYLKYFYFFPQWSLRTGYYNPSGQYLTWQNLHMYGAVVFPLFLADKFGSTIVKRIWDGCATVPGGNWWLATDAAIKTVSADSLNMREMFKRFTIWNLFTGAWARSGSYFPEALYYPSPLGTFAESPAIKRFAKEISTYPDSVVLPDSLKPDNLGADYILLKNLSAFTSGLAVTFEGDRTQPWDIQVVGLPLNVSDLSKSIFIDDAVYDSNSTTITIGNAASFDKIVLIPAILGGNAKRVNYRLNVSSLAAGISTPNGGERLYPGAIVAITWFFVEPFTEALLELSLDNGANWSAIATTPNNHIYQWTVPDTPSDSCLIRVSNAAGGGPSDVSNAVFTIAMVGETRINEPFPNPVWVQLHRAITFRGELQAGLAGQSPEMTVSVMTLAGEQVIELRKFASGGAAEIEWNLTNDNGETVAAGPYLAVINFAGLTEVKKFVVLR